MKIGVVPNTPMKILLEPYYFEYEGEVLKIPQGFAFDGLSIPQPFQWIVDMNDSNGLEAALIHDWFYSRICSIKISRLDADLDLFMRLTFPPNVIVIIGVRIGGWLSWRKDKNYKKHKRKIINFKKHIGLDCTSLLKENG